MELGFWNAVNCAHLVAYLAFNIGGTYGQSGTVPFVEGTWFGSPKEAVSWWGLPKEDKGVGHASAKEQKKSGTRVVDTDM